MSINRLTLPLLVLGALACHPLPERGTGGPAAGNSEAGATASSEPEMVCKTERPTGSSISRRVCRPKDSGAADRAQLEQIQRNASRANHNAP